MRTQILQFIHGGQAHHRGEMVRSYLRHSRFQVRSRTLAHRNRLTALYMTVCACLTDSYDSTHMLYVRPVSRGPGTKASNFRQIVNTDIIIESRLTANASRSGPWVQVTDTVLVCTGPSVHSPTLTAARRPSHIAQRAVTTTTSLPERAEALWCRRSRSGSSLSPT